MIDFSEKIKELAKQVNVDSLRYNIDCMGNYELVVNKSNNNIPKRYIINKGATILFWKDGTKTIVKRNKEDEHNPRLAFLTAYFQKNCGLSKNKANKYLDSLIEEENNEVK